MKHTIPHGNWHMALARIIEQANDGDIVVCHTAEVAKSRMCPNKLLIRYSDEIRRHRILYLSDAYCPACWALPILKYRHDNIESGLASDSSRCYLVLDDMAVIGDEHYPCIIYAREGGAAIGRVGDERMAWSRNHNCKADKICYGNCLDVCRDYKGIR